MYALSNCDMTSYTYTKAKIKALNTLVTDESSGYCTGGRWRDTGGSDGKNRFSSHCMVSHREHPWLLPVSQYSSISRNGPKSEPCLQHQPPSLCTYCGQIYKQTSKPHMTSQPMSLCSARRSEIGSKLILLARLT